MGLPINDSLDSKINFEDFDVICRVCLNETGLQIFEQKFLELYNTLLNTSEIKHDLDMPHQICEECLEQLENISKFITKSLRNEKILQEAYLKRNCTSNFHEEAPKYDVNVSVLLANTDDKTELSCSDSNITKVNNKNKGKNSYECKTCCNTFYGKTAFTSHNRLHKNQEYDKKFLCNYCGKNFVKNSHLERHIRIHTGIRPYKCEKCEKCFGQGNDLKRHYLTHSRDKIFKCGQCTKAFHQKSCLDNHILTHTDEKNFQCRFCEKRFILKSYLEIHMRTHTGNKPFHCLQCDKQFHQKSGLNNHMLYHSGIKPFKCEVCLKSFSQSNHLKEHMKIHSGERPFVCSYCGKAFANNSTLKVHLRQHTGEKPFKCSSCSKRFYDASNLRRHCKRHHSA